MHAGGTVRTPSVPRLQHPPHYLLRRAELHEEVVPRSRRFLLLHAVALRLVLDVLRLISGTLALPATCLTVPGACATCSFRIHFVPFEASQRFHGRRGCGGSISSLSKRRRGLCSCGRYGRNLRLAIPPRPHRWIVSVAHSSSPHTGLSQSLFPARTSCFSHGASRSQAARTSSLW